MLTVVNQTGILNANTFKNSFNAYPNPANDAMNITFTLSKNSDVNISIINLLGQTESTLLNKKLPAGVNVIHSTDLNLADGVYFIQLKEDNEVVSTRRIVISK